jgi:hypothetical protein
MLNPLESGIELPMGLAQRREYEDKKMKETTFAERERRKETTVTQPLSISVESARGLGCG